MKDKLYQYVFIGAGPSAICAIVKLLGRGVLGEEILWLDPNFKVGDFGSRWMGVPGNARVEMYQKVIQEILKILPDIDHKTKFKLDRFSPEFTCSLADAAEPMQDITDHLLQIVQHHKATVTKIIRAPQGWEIKLSNGLHSYLTKRVILATGVKTKKISLSVAVKELPLEIVVDQYQLQQLTKTLGTVAVIGSSHSAALATMHLLQGGAKVIQFMNKPYKYAVPVFFENKTSMLFDNTGLKGRVAEWTRELITTAHDKQYADKIKFLQSAEDTLKTYLPMCDYVVFAMGFEPTSSVQIEDYFPVALKHDPKTTIICDGIFGIGSAFPLKLTDRFAVTENAVGVDNFWFDISNTILAIWDNYTAICSKHLHSVMPEEKPSMYSEVRAKL